MEMTPPNPTTPPNTVISPGGSSVPSLARTGSDVSEWEEFFPAKDLQAKPNE